jgi:6-phosphogluconolactonase
MTESTEFRILVMDDDDAVSRKAAEAIEEYARQRVKENGDFTLALAGGSTPKAVYAHLANASLHGNMPWPETRLFWGDERKVSPEHAYSNYKMVYESLLKNGPVPLENIFPIQTSLATAAECADRYEKTLSEKITTKEDGFPVFDLILLGVGPDGHIASLFPGTPAPLEQSRAVTWCDPTAANPNVNPPVERISISAPVILRAANVFVLASGETKRDVLRKVLASGTTDAPPVARLLLQRKRTLSFFVDQAAFPKGIIQR